MSNIVPNFLIQGGDITHGDGTGGESIYGGKFEDETFEVLHNTRYMLAMANAGPNTNGSQFFINTVKMSWLDGTNVIFGTVLEGTGVVDELETLGTNSGKTRKEIMIKRSGILKPNHDLNA
jgi:peptidylprolyl isomerase